MALFCACIAGYGVIHIISVLIELTGILSSQKTTTNYNYDFDKEYYSDQIEDLKNEIEDLIIEREISDFDNEYFSDEINRLRDEIEDISSNLY